MLLAAVGPAISMKWVVQCMLYIFMWVPVEAFLLATWGTTPGKWLMQTTVTTEARKKLGFSAALTRSLYVWAWGIGIGFPYAFWVGEMFSYLDLRNKGVTRWDAQSRHVVRHQAIGTHRLLVSVLLFALVGLSLSYLADIIAHPTSVAYIIGLLVLFGVAITWLVIVDLKTAA